MKCLVFFGNSQFLIPSTLQVYSLMLIREVYFIGEVCRGLNVDLIIVIAGIVLSVISIVLCCERPPKGPLAHGSCEGLNQGNHKVDYLSSLLGHRVNLRRVVTIDEMS